jgi:O-antigen biosynthesis protein
MSQSPDPQDRLSWTGERYMPFVRGDIELEHLHRYAFARELATQKEVLDIACGEGYGSYLLAGTAKRVIGVDMSPEAIRHGESRYATSNLEFRQGECSRIPLENSSVDMVVSFETIEHHDQHESMLAEIKRVLRPDGMLVISTPERELLHRLNQQRNEFHVKELSLPEFSGLLARHFRNTAMFGHRVRYGSLMAPIAITEVGEGFCFYSGNADSIAATFHCPEPLFLVALASQVNLPVPSVSFFDGTDYFRRKAAADQRVLTAERDALAADVARIKATVSWRLTKPIRLFAFLGRCMADLWKDRGRGSRR